MQAWLEAWSRLMYSWTDKFWWQFVPSSASQALTPPLKKLHRDGMLHVVVPPVAAFFLHEQVRSLQPVLSTSIVEQDRDLFAVEIVSPSSMPIAHSPLWLEENLARSLIDPHGGIHPGGYIVVFPNRNNVATTNVATSCSREWNNLPRWHAGHGVDSQRLRREVLRLRNSSQAAKKNGAQDECDANGTTDEAADSDDDDDVDDDDDDNDDDDDDDDDLLVVDGGCVHYKCYARWVGISRMEELAPRGKS